MHSSRVRTGRALTVSGGGWCIPEEILGAKKLKKKKKKLEPPPKDWKDPPKEWKDTPPEKFETPKKLETP